MWPYVTGGGWEISTPSGVRKPDVLVIPMAVARAAIVHESPKPIPGTGVRLVVEVLSPGSRSERADRVHKVREYAALGIPQYWIVEHRPNVRIHQGILTDSAYEWERPVASGGRFVAEIDVGASPLPAAPVRAGNEGSRATISVAFDPAVLIDI